jgi:GDP-D-mannose 3',5'-epimerase
MPSPMPNCRLCMQVLTSTKDIEMWGDGMQTRSFTFIDDCVEGILRITKSDFKEPLNLGSSEMVSTALLLMSAHPHTV